MELLLVVAGLVVVLADLWLWRRSCRRAHGRLPRAVLAFVAVLFVVVGTLSAIAGGYGFWYTHRPLPGDTRQALFEGVTYFREVRSQPRPLVIHVVTIDLDAPGIGFLVTPGQRTGDRQLPARTTSQFLSEFGLQIAVNGDFFEPWWSNSPFDYYPHAGDPVDVFGFSSSKGSIYAHGRPDWPIMYISEDNKIGLNTPIGDVYNAISGNVIFVEHGKLTTDESLMQPYHLDPHPRTAAGLTADGRTLILVVVDGRQPNYSEGITIPELAYVMTKYGADTALNLDGGGSSTLVVQGPAGRPVDLNSPIDNRIPGRERPVANHLGIYARRLGASS
jgi:Phosphodiester glycosidase